VWLANLCPRDVRWVRLGFTNPLELRLMGFSYSALRFSGFSDRQLVLEAKFTVEEVIDATGYTAEPLGQAGFKPSELKAAGPCGCGRCFGT
jgi:hypothetical protein